MREKIFALPVHPFLFALWPIVGLYAQSADEAGPAYGIVRSAFAITVLALMLTAALWTWVRDLRVSAVGASVAVWGYCVLWGPLRDQLFLSAQSIPGWSPAIPALAYTVTVLLAVGWIVRRRRIPRIATPMLNVFASTLLVIAAWPLLQPLPSSSAALAEEVDYDEVRLPRSPAESLPNVFFIVLDGYARADVLRDYFGYDNSPFIHRMEELGFVHVANSKSDYRETLRSLPSCMNMNYRENNGSAARTLIYRNSVNDAFLNAGYAHYTFETGFAATEPFGDPERILRPRFSDWTINEFEAVFIESTAFSQLANLMGEGGLVGAWRRRILFTLENLHRPIELANGAPVYVQAHVISPHPPNVFDEYGRAHEPDGQFSLIDSGSGSLARKRQEYLNQLRGLNLHVEASIERILDASPTPPIIAIISDHGPFASLTSDEARTSNLCLLHFPGVSPDAIPPGLRLTNLFRVLFNLNFGTNLELLSDRPAPSSPAAKPDYGISVIVGE